MTLDLSAALEQIEAMHDDNMRLAEIDCENCNHHALIVVRFDSPESVKCPKCGDVLDLLNEDEIMLEVNQRNAQQPIYDAASHAATVAQRHAVIAPDFDLFDMCDTTGKNVMPMTVKDRCLLNLINNDQGMMGDRD